MFENRLVDITTKHVLQLGPWQDLCDGLTCEHALFCISVAERPQHEGNLLASASWRVVPVIASLSVVRGTAKFPAMSQEARVV
jgi:hypothetical protein